MIELATAETFTSKTQTSAAAGVSLSNQTMHRAHGPEAETHFTGGTDLGRKTLHRKYARRFGTPRSPWEARLYGTVEGTVNRKIAVIWQGVEGAKTPVKPIVLLCPDGLSGINI